MQKNWQPFSEQQIFQVRSADELLTAKRRKIVEEIQAIAAIPEKHFAALYQQLVISFINLAQILPTSNDSKLGSIVDEGLLRGLFVMQAINQESKEKPGYLTTYVLFSAALLFDISSVLENRMVLISSKQGAFIERWNPFSGAMEWKNFYRIRRLNDDPYCYKPWICRRMTTVLAKSIMPEVGFNWIAKDAHSLNNWLALLLDDKKGAGELSLFFKLAEEKLEDFKIKEGFLDFIPPETIESEFKLAEDFINWLKQEIKNGGIGFNKPNSKIIMLEQEKVLIDLDGLVKKFKKDMSSKASEKEITDEIEKLGFKGEEIRYQTTIPPSQNKSSATLFAEKSHTQEQATTTQITHAQSTPLHPGISTSLAQQTTVDISFNEGKPFLQAILSTLPDSPLLQTALAAIAHLVAPKVVALETKANVTSPLPNVEEQIRPSVAISKT